MSDDERVEAFVHEADVSIDEPLVEKPRPTARGIAIAGARVVSALVALGVAGVVVAGAHLLPLPTVSATPPSTLVSPVPTGQQLTCPGALLRLADASGQAATQASALGSPDLRYASDAGTIAATPLPQSEAGTGGGPGAPTVLSTPPGAADSAATILVGGAQSQVVSTDEFAGLAAAACTVAGAESWLVGGATTVGRTTLISLANPSAVASTVDLEIFGPRGAIDAPGLTGIIVGPGSQRVLSLAGFAPDLASPVVHVSSAGGLIEATMQQSIVRGLEPGGIDIVGPSAAPATEQVIPGLVMTDLVALEERLEGETGDDLITAVRIFLPGDTAATTTVSYVPDDGSTNGRSFELELEPGVVTEIPEPELPDGSYTVQLESTLPIVAAARVSSVGNKGVDVAWFAAAPKLGDRSLVVVPAGADATMHLANTNESPATVTISSAGDDDLTIAIPPRSAVVTPVRSSAVYSIDGSNGVAIAVTVTDRGRIASFTAEPPAAASTPVRIYR